MYEYLQTHQKVSKCCAQRHTVLSPGLDPDGWALATKWLDPSWGLPTRQPDGKQRIFCSGLPRDPATRGLKDGTWDPRNNRAASKSAAAVSLNTKANWTH